MQCHTKRAIGADLDNSSIRLVEASYQKGKYQFENQFTYSRQPGWHIALASFSFKTKNVVVSVPDSQVLIKKIILSSKLSAREKEEYLAFEMEKLAHCPKEEIYLDYKILEKLENNCQEILCATIRRQVVESLLEFFQNTPFKVIKITLDSEVLPFYSESDDEKYQKAYALAVSGFQKAVFNFLPWREKKRQFQKHMMLLGAVFFSVLILWGFLSYSCFFENAIEAKPVKQIKTAVIKKAKNHSIKQGHSLNDSPIQKLKMLGMIANNGKCWGLVKTPDGKIVHVTISDIVGLEQVQIINISPKKIIGKKNNRSYAIE